MGFGSGDDDTGGGAAVPLTQAEAQSLTNLVRAVRSQTPGAGAWDEAGVMAALRKVSQLGLVEVIGAAIRAAENPDLKTPAAIGNPATEVWRPAPPKPVAYVPTPREDYCDWCGKTRDLCQLIATGPTGDGHEFDSGLPDADPETGELIELPDTTQARARVRAAIRKDESA